MHKTYIALYELQTVALILCKSAFYFSGNVVFTLYLDNSIVKAYLCNQGGIVSLSFQFDLPHFEFH